MAEELELLMYGGHLYTSKNLHHFTSAQAQPYFFPLEGHKLNLDTEDKTTTKFHASAD